MIAKVSFVLVISYSTVMLYIGTVEARDSLAPKTSLIFTYYYYYYYLMDMKKLQQ